MFSKFPLPQIQKGFLPSNGTVKEMTGPNGWIKITHSAAGNQARGINRNTTDAKQIWSLCHELTSPIRRNVCGARDENIATKSPTSWPLMREVSQHDCSFEKKVWIKHKHGSVCAHYWVICCTAVERALKNLHSYSYVTEISLNFKQHYWC